MRVPDPFDVEEFRAGLAEVRGRPIRLIPVRQPSTPDTSFCGRCVSSPAGDYVFYARTLSDLHVTHNQVHELAHLIFDHPWVGGAIESYGTRAESEADAMAAVLLGRWQDPAPRSWAATSRLYLGASRLEEALS